MTLTEMNASTLQKQRGEDFSYWLYATVKGVRDKQRPADVMKALRRPRADLYQKASIEAASTGNTSSLRLESMAWMRQLGAARHSQPDCK